MHYKKGDNMDRFKKANNVSLLGIVGNIFLFIIKVIVGIIASSQAMIADSVNSAGDIFSSTNLSPVSISTP